jgi:hypothetical protein
MIEAIAKVSQAASPIGIISHISRSITGSDYYLDLQLHMDLRLIASLSNGNLFFGRPLAALPAWLATFGTASPAARC